MLGVALGVAPADGGLSLRPLPNKGIIEKPTNASTASTNTILNQGLRF
jgi:hypothetical protein